MMIKFTSLAILTKLLNFTVEKAISKGITDNISSANHPVT